MSDKTSEEFLDGLVEPILKEAGKNPAQSAADDILSIVKELSDLEVKLAKMPNRQEIAERAGLSDLHSRIDALYAMADEYRLGGIQTLPIYASLSGDPDKIREDFLAVKANKI